MAEAAVDPGRNPLRFFCHRCNIEFEDVIQNSTCPFCSTGFVEQLENGDSLLQGLEDGEYSDAEMSNLDDAGGLDDTLDEILDGSNTSYNEIPPMLNDLAFLMSGGRVRGVDIGVRGVDIGTRPVQRETLMEQLVWMIGGGRPGTGAVTAGAPFVLVGAPGDYVFGGEGLDAVVTQLLGQLENTGPPPLPTEQIATIPSEEITVEQVEASQSCSVCWDAFNLGEAVSKLECAHIFHPACITPWLQLHATCPICRRNLLPTVPAAPAPAADGTTTEPPASTTTPSRTDSDMSGTSSAISRVVVRRIGGRRRRAAPPGSSSSSSASGRPPPAAPVGAIAGLWADLTSTIQSLANGDSSSSLNSSDTNRYMDIDYD